MGWADQYIKQLQKGKTIQFRPRGNSMSPVIWSGALVTVRPIKTELLLKSDIVLCKVRGRQYLHYIKAIQGNSFQIGNARGHINGWITKEAMFGLVTDIKG